jgi:hypothetical protein
MWSSRSFIPVRRRAPGTNTCAPRAASRKLASCAMIWSITRRCLPTFLPHARLLDVRSERGQRGVPRAPLRELHSCENSPSSSSRTRAACTCEAPPLPPLVIHSFSRHRTAGWPRVARPWERFVWPPLAASVLEFARASLAVAAMTASARRPWSLPHRTSLQSPGAAPALSPLGAPPCVTAPPPSPYALRVVPASRVCVKTATG